VQAGARAGKFGPKINKKKLQLGSETVYRAHRIFIAVKQRKETKKDAGVNILG
jgi:hypothetical protein